MIKVALTMTSMTSGFALAKRWHLNRSIGVICHSHSSSCFNTQYSNTVRKYSKGTMEKTLTLENMNANVIKMEYAVRGPLVIRATAIEKEMQNGMKKPFSEVIKANIGDAHAMGQKPISFLRQVISMCLLPELLDSPQYPNDVKQRVNTILNGCKGRSLGSYSDSVGIEVIRKHIAEYIERRDGFPSNYEDVVLSAGASSAICSLLTLFVTQGGNEKSGIMVPIPQYPLYSATTAAYGLHQINYYLDESKNWGLDITELERAVEEAKKICKPKAICVINPGNPTGQVLTKENIIDIIKFAHRENLFIFADEVYQHNVYADGSEFHSFKKVLMELGPPYNEKELASFMSCSKGYMGECGLRGGYAETINMDPEVKKMYFKMLSAALCPTTLGQAAVECVVNPPQPGEPSYKQFLEEKAAVLSSLAKRAKMVVETFNSIDGISCQNVQGAMYAFPQVTFPPKLIEEAAKNGQEADVFYAFQLLENTGICVVPGSGFCQRPGTYHFRTTILPQPEKLEIMLNKFKVFHTSFIAKYSE